MDIGAEWGSWVGQRVLRRQVEFDLPGEASLKATGSFSLPCRLGGDRRGMAGKDPGVRKFPLGSLQGME